MRSILALGWCFTSLTVVFAPSARGANEYFAIQIIDEETGRGVPLVELRTTGSISAYTDSGGFVAFNEPGLMNRPLYFHISSHGYEFPEGPFGFRGTTLTPRSGERAILKVKRNNLAERLYRITGAGIYRDSVLLGETPPLKEPLINGRVSGQDSVQMVPFNNQYYWFWGDTSRPDHPLGNFAVSGATSTLDGDPDRCIDFTYFIDEKGFSRPMCPIEGPGPKWFDGLMVVDEKLIAKYMRVKTLGELYEQGLAIFDSESQSFEKLIEFDLDALLIPRGHPVLIGQDYYFGYPFPNVRSGATLESIKDIASYEALFWNGDEYVWSVGTPPLDQKSERDKIVNGNLDAIDAWIHLRDVDTGQPIHAHSGSVYWNDFRKRWVAIISEVEGSSYLGEVWYAEGDSVLGPWVYARKILTHDRYSFYNVKQHPYFDNGPFIYFEGTYTDFAVKNPNTTPRYNYNQIMYRLDLSSFRVPVPVYHAGDRFLTHEYVKDWDSVDQIAFFAHDRDGSGLIDKGGYFALSSGKPEGDLIEHVGCLVWRNPGRQLGRLPRN